MGKRSSSLQPFHSMSPCLGKGVSEFLAGRLCGARGVQQTASTSGRWLSSCSVPAPPVPLHSACGARTRLLFICTFRDPRVPSVLPLMVLDPSQTPQLALESRPFPCCRVLRGRVTLTWSVCTCSVFLSSLSPGAPRGPLGCLREQVRRQTEGADAEMRAPLVCRNGVTCVFEMRLWTKIDVAAHFRPEVCRPFLSLWAGARSPGERVCQANSVSPPSASSLLRGRAVVHLPRV